MSIDGETPFVAPFAAAGIDAGITHAQHSHADGICPTSAADTNGDGGVDVVEGVPSYGGILIPLDDHLTSQARDGFPVATTAGVVDYDGTAPLNQVDRSVRGADEDPFVGLPSSEELHPGVRTVACAELDLVDAS